MDTLHVWIKVEKHDSYIYNSIADQRVHQNAIYIARFAPHHGQKETHSDSQEKLV